MVPGKHATLCWTVMKMLGVFIAEICDLISDRIGHTNEPVYSNADKLLL
jgi:hypothetical protein